MVSLLGQFYNRIKGSQEDIASESLVYILQQSLESRKVINQIIKMETNLSLSDLNYQTQNVGDNLERPDISGKDDTGREVLLIEAKFWASLTHNQPNEYLKRLGENSVLIFLVPSLRVRVVFQELKNRILEEFQEVDVDFQSLKFSIFSTNQHILIKSWSEVLNSMKVKFEQTNNIALLSDLNQIIGLCNIIDRDAFQPITDENLSPEIPKRINSYYEVIDKVVDQLNNRGIIGITKMLSKTPQRYGYHRYFVTEDLALSLCLKLDLWEKCAETPFWLNIENIPPQIIEKISFKNNLTFVPNTVYKGYFIALKPKLFETEDVVIYHLVIEIEKIINDIRLYIS